MFRETEKSKLLNANFSVGSTIKVGNFNKYIVISSDTMVVSLLDTTTFEVLKGSSTKVLDINYLSKEEVAKLIDCLNCTFNEPYYSTIGAKGLF